MFKYFFIIFILASVFLLIRPDQYFKSNVEIEDKGIKEKIQQADKNFSDSRRPSLLVNGKSKNTSNYSEFADGYQEGDFISVKEPEEMFKTKNEQLSQSSGGLWEVFLKLRFDISYDRTTDDVVMKPLFIPEIKKYNHQIIEISGYIIPNDIVHGAVGARGNGSMFMLSAFPTATCFFCKGAGPESVMEVYPKKPIPYSKSTVKIKGRLELNDYDYMKMAYILKDAYLVE
jgi:hypothetical protein